MKTSDGVNIKVSAYKAWSLLSGLLEGRLSNAQLLQRALGHVEKSFGQREIHLLNSPDMSKNNHAIVMWLDMADDPPGDFHGMEAIVLGFFPDINITTLSSMEKQVQGLKWHDYAKGFYI